MRVIIGIVAPALHVRSGYGIQAAHLARSLRKDGHEVVVYAIAGVGAAVLTVEGVRHYPGGRLQYQADTLVRNVADSGADVVITLCDLAHQDTNNIAALRAAGVQVLHWVPADCEPLGIVDDMVLRVGGGHPVAMSRFGERMLAGAGFTPSYVPHCVDTGTFRPLGQDQRAEMRAAVGLDGKFAVAVNAANTDRVRKGSFEMWHGFHAFHAKHPDSVLWLHSELDGAFDHAGEARQLGLESAVAPTDDHLIKTGQLDAGYMAGWYNAADVYLCSSWAEGFGVPLIESQACGLPAIGTDCSAVTELVQPGAGWRVPSELKANPLQKRSWRAPWIKGIEQALAKAHAAWKAGTPGTGGVWQGKQQRARAFAEAYAVDVVHETYWRPLLKRCEAGDFRGQPGG